MTLTVLSVAYPFAPVGPDTAGGAEQVLFQIDRALVEAGHRSIVVGLTGSRISGTLLPVPAATGALNDTVQQATYAIYRRVIERAVERHGVDLIHMHGVDFHEYLPPAGFPTIITLHLPPSWYPEGTLEPPRPDTWFNCVSATQHRSCAESIPLLPPIPNGVPVGALAARHAKRRFALNLGRICPEKGVHIALDAAKHAGVPLVVAGNVSSFAAHRVYFEEEVKPRLGPGRRYIGPVGFVRKRSFLTAARCLVLPTLAPETSSLVAMEALACGTPVVAFPSGAIPESVEHGRTGFIVHNEWEMAEAIKAADTLDPETCRAVARERFSVDTMVARYLDLYRLMATRKAA